VAHRIVYYHGCVVDTFDHETGHAVIKVLELTGHQVEVPDLICCSYPLLNSGEIGVARQRAARLVSQLSKYVGRGYTIVFSCPTCGYALKEVYPRLLSCESADVVAENTHFISSYLLQLHEAGERRIPVRELPIRVGYHTPCHLRAKGVSTASLELLCLIPKTEVLHLDRGCCGMGGTWALRSKARNELSAKVGGPLFKRIQETGLHLVATDCFGCQVQIGRFAHCRMTHPMKILADACA
jgi:glycerol-3-phosphate dehydrogenase subunit C